MIHPIKIEFKEYPSGSWADWSDYLATPPSINRKVESENDGEAGLIVFDTASVELYYTPGSPVYTAFTTDLTNKQRYLFRISFYTGSAYEQLFEGMADFTTIDEPELSNVIQFDIVDKLSAIGILEASTLRNKNVDVFARSGADGIDTILHMYQPNSSGVDYLVFRMWDHTAGDQGRFINFTNTGILQLGEIFTITEDDKEKLALVIGTPEVIPEVAIDVAPPNTQYQFNSVRVKVIVSEPFNYGGTSVFYQYSSSKLIYDKLMLGVDINIISGSTLQAYDGEKIIEAIVKQQWSDITFVNRTSASPFSVPLNYFTETTGELPFNKEPLDALKMLADSMKCYIYFNRAGELVIQSKDDLGTNGTTRSIGSTRKIDANKKRFWDKLIDAAEVKIKSWVQVGGEFLEGFSLQTKAAPGSSSYIKPKNKLTKELFASSSTIDTQAELDAEAATEASEYLNFYGKRRSAIDLILELDNNVLLWDLLDNIIYNSVNYFFTSLDLDLVEKEANLELVEVQGHDYDLRSVVIPLSENQQSTISSGGTTSGGGSTFAGYTFNEPLSKLGVLVDLNYTNNLKVTAGELDTAQPIKTTDNVEFAGIGIGGDYDAAYAARVYGGLKVDNDAAVDGTLSAANISAGNTVTDNLAVFGAIDLAYKARIYGDVKVDSDLVVSGSVGVGTTVSNDAELTVATQSGASIRVGATDGGNQVNSGSIEFLEITSGVTWGEAGSYGYRFTHDGSANILKIQSSVGDAVTDIVSFNRSGNIGVGNLSGLAKMHISSPTWGDHIKIDRSGNYGFLTISSSGGLYIGANSGSGTPASSNMMLIANSGHITTPKSLTVQNNALVLGNFGVGTVSPQKKAHIIGSPVGNASYVATDTLVVEDAEGTMEFVAADTGNFGASFLLTNIDTVTGNRKGWGLLNKASSSYNRFSICYSTVADINNYYEVLTITPAGNVAIGLPMASEKLEVAGNTKITGNIIQTGNYSYYNNFTSGWTGSGFRLDYGITNTNMATLELDDLWVRGTMHVYEFVINQIRATNGSLFVSSSAKVESVTNSSAPNEVIVIEDAAGHGIAPFAAGDLILVQRVRLDSTTIVKRLVRVVKTIVGTSISFQAASGAPSDAGTFEVGDVIVRFGHGSDTNRQGSLYLTSDDSNAPYMDVIDDVTSWADWKDSSKLKVRLGKLTGISTSNFGTLSDYGLFTRRLYLESGSSSGIAMKVDADTAYFAMKQGSNTVFDFDTASETAHLSGWDVDHLKVGKTFSSFNHVGMYSAGYFYAGYGYAPFDDDTGVMMGLIPSGQPNSGSIGIQARDNYGLKTYFTLTNNIRRISAWDFDYEKLYNGDVRLEASASFKGLGIKNGADTVVKVGDFTNAAESYFTTAQSLPSSTWTQERISHGSSYTISNASNTVSFTPNTSGVYTQVSIEYSKTLPINDIKGKAIKVQIGSLQEDGAQVAVTGMIKVDGRDIDMKDMSTPVGSDNTYTFYANIPADAVSAEFYFYYFYSSGSTNPAVVYVDFDSIHTYEKSVTELNKDGMKIYSSPISSVNLTKSRADFNVAALKTTDTLQVGNFRFYTKIGLNGDGSTYQQLILQFYNGTSWTDEGKFNENGTYSSI